MCKAPPHSKEAKPGRQDTYHSCLALPVLRVEERREEEGGKERQRRSEEV